MQRVKFSEIQIGERFMDTRGKAYIRLPRYRSDVNDADYNAICLDELIIEDAVCRVEEAATVYRLDGESVRALNVSA
jgi:hypothetical protein